MEAEKLKKKIAHVMQISKKTYQVLVDEGYESGRMSKPFDTLEEAQQALNEISIFFKKMFAGADKYVDGLLSIVEFYEVDGEWLDKWEIKEKMERLYRRKD